MLNQSLVASQALKLTDLGVQQSKVICDFCGCADRGAAIGRAAFSGYGDSRRNSFDPVRSWFFQAIQELSRVSGKALDITSLPLGVERVQCNACFTTPTHPAKNHQLMMGYIQVQVLQVMDVDTP